MDIREIKRQLAGSRAGKAWKNRNRKRVRETDEKRKKYRKQFSDTAKRLVKTEMEMLFQDVSHFCNMFDYRNSDLKADWGNSRDSIERTIGFLTGRTEFVEKSKKTN